MMEVLNVIAWIGFAYILFIYIRGMNETQVQKHVDMLDKNKKKKEEQDKND